MNDELLSRYKTDEKLNLFILGLSSIQNLTYLSLHGFHDMQYSTGKLHKTLYKSIAKSCPSLSHLSIDCGFDGAMKVDVLSLILIEELVDQMFVEGSKPWWRIEETMWGEDETLQRLRVPPGCLTPLCSTLEYLYLGGCNHTGRLVSTFALALRHLPKLQNLDGCDSSTSMAVEIFHDSAGMEDLSIQADFEEFFSLDKNSSLRLPSSGNKIFILNLLNGSYQLYWYFFKSISFLVFLETLWLTTLKCVFLRNRHLLSILGKCCPFLKDVEFSGVEYDLSSMKKRDVEEYTRTTRLNDRPGLGDLESILRSWPKVNIFLTLYFKSSNDLL